MLVRSQAQSDVQSIAIPQVFIIGEYEDQYLALSQQHPAVFLSIYDNNIDQAFAGWSELLMDIEDFSTELNFDLRGVKLWLNVFFNADGTISNLAFYPKPNSRNVPEEHLVAFFKNFTRHYMFTETNEKGFQHSASASFPTFFHRSAPVTSKGN
jgi:hypothetical protein